MNLKQTVAFYNTAPNILWSVLNFLPVSIFCYRFVELNMLLTFLTISFLTVLLPISFLHKLQLSNRVSAYKSLGVHWINKFTQNGEIINRMIRKRFPEYRVVSGRKPSIKKLVGQTYMFEKFHVLLFTFFTFITGLAIIMQYPGWVLIITITNVIYNVYPCLLQQYIRLKLLNFQRNYPQKV